MRSVRTVPLVVLLSSFALSCGGSGGADPGSARESWSLYRGDSGLVLLHPPGWTVHERGGGAFAVVHANPSGAADAVVAVQPIERIEGSALGVVREVGRVLPDLFPDARTDAPELCSEEPEVAVAELAYEAGGNEYVGTAMCFRSGRRGVLYAYAAGGGAPADVGGDMRRMLQTFRYTAPGGAGVPADGPPETVAWRDPNENAFTCPVPRGWTVDGGLARFHAVDVRPEVLVTSPDGEILVRLGDAWIPPFVTPGPMLTSTGFGEGMWYSPDGLLRVLVQRYLPGAEFATAVYLPERVGSFRITRRNDLPQISSEAAARWRQAGIEVRVDTGEVEFTASTDDGSRFGYALAQTVFLPMMGSPSDGNWFVTALNGYLAAPGREAEAGAVMAAMLQGFRMNPQWVAGIVRTAGEVSRITWDTQQEINRIIHSTWTDRQASQDRTAERWAEANRGLTVIEDPATGEQFEVPLGSDYWWRLDDTGTLLGTEGALTPQVPGYWVREMEERR